MSQLLGHQSSPLPNWGTWARAQAIPPNPVEGFQVSRNGRLSRTTVRNVLAEHIQSGANSVGVETLHGSNGFLDGLTGDKSFGNQKQQLI